MTPQLRGLSDKVVLITGAARGQGANHARAFAEAGCDIVALDICSDIVDLPYGSATTADLELTVKEVESLGRRAVGYVCDVRDEAQVGRSVSEALQEFERIDVLINNAGMCALDSIGEMRPSVFNAIIDINLKGPMWVAKHVVPQMIERRTGNIINISSAATTNGNGMMSHYVSSKYGIIGLTKSWAFELSEFGINVNAISPTSIRPTDDRGSGMVRGLAHHIGVDPMEAYGMWNERGCLAGEKWQCEMQDITDACLYLASDNARLVTGHVLDVDGGQAVR